MRRRLLMLMTIVAGALLQQLLPPWPMFGGMKPPILAALALHYALRRDNRDMWLVVFTAAVFQDGLTMATFGPALLTFPVMGYLANRIRTEVFSDGIVTQMIFGAAIGLFCCLVALMVYTVSGQRPFHLGLSLSRLIGSTVLGMITLPLVSRAIIRIEAMIPKRRDYGWQ